MIVYSDFASLFQLGIGIGIGLSLFRAPIDVRIASLSKRMDGELVALRGVTSSFGKSKRRDVMALKLRFLDAKQSLDGKVAPFMACAVAAGGLNLIGLIVATLRAQEEMSNWEVAAGLLISVAVFLVIIGWLEVIARTNLDDLRDALVSLQTRQEA